MSWFQYVVLAGIAAVWAWVLGRPLVMNLFNMARRDPVGHFNKKMSVLGEAPQRSLGQSTRTAPSFGRGMAATGPSSAKRRRLQIFMALIIAAVVSLGLAVAFRGVFIVHHLLMDALLVGYMLLAARAGAMESERQAKVSYLTPNRPAASPISIRAVSEG